MSKVETSSRLTSAGIKFEGGHDGLSTLSVDRVYIKPDYDAVIWDVDGTLADTECEIRRGVFQVLGELVQEHFGYDSPHEFSEDARVEVIESCF